MGTSTKAREFELPPFPTWPEVVHKVERIEQLKDPVDARGQLRDFIYELEHVPGRLPAAVKREMRKPWAPMIAYLKERLEVLERPIAKGRGPAIWV